jgi:AraC-like DNA-binding protein
MARTPGPDLLNVDWNALAALVRYQAPLLARHFNIHPRRLQREFRKQLQTTPQRHLDNIRIEAAKELAMKRVRTKEISFRLGFKRESQLCRQFHVITGVGLKDFRQGISQASLEREPMVSNMELGPSVSRR